MKYLKLILFLSLFNQILFSQELVPDGGGEVSVLQESNCLSKAQRQDIQLMLNENVKELKKKGLLSETNLNTKVSVAFDWPLQKTAGLAFNSYYATNNFVDQNTGSGLLDYNCDARTYNGHNGTDIDTWPFPWYIYNNDFVEVIAGEVGIITGKTDGNDDDHCSCSGDWNAVFVQHADNSTAWYGHLKKNSLTTKTVGQSVAKGEYIGVVASSGCSTQPHLHFEVYDNSNNLIDPYSGPCNSLNGSSWWASQPANREPTLNALLTHDAVPVHGCPGVNESPHFSDAFIPGQTIYMATYYHDQLNGDVSNLRIKKPDNSIWQSWSHTSNNTYTKSWWYWNWTLPSGGPFGTWKFEVDYKGQTYSHDFLFLSSLPVELVDFNAKKVGDNSIQLLWNTASEINFSGFEIQQSIDGIVWDSISFIEIKKNSQETNDYMYLDVHPFDNINYYRLKQIDIDGKFEYSNIVFIDMGEGEEISVYPNPSTRKITISGVQNGQIKVYDTLGRLVLESAFTSDLDISGLLQGVYFISIQFDHQTIVRKVIKE
jgi:Peptidase family M23/Secretion system C-terminal sorting domain